MTYLYFIQGVSPHLHPKKLTENKMKLYKIKIGT